MYTEQNRKETEYRIVLDALEQTQRLPEEAKEVRVNLLEWMINNKEMRLMEEAEDMLDGLEDLKEAGEMGMTNNILMETTEVITALVLAKNPDMEKITIAGLLSGCQLAFAWLLWLVARRSFF